MFNFSSEEEVRALTHDQINRYIAEMIMGEPEPTYTHNHWNVFETKYSEVGNWTCDLFYENSDECSWKPLDFCNSEEYSFMALRKMGYIWRGFSFCEMFHPNKILEWQVGWFEFSQGDYEYRAVSCDKDRTVALCRAMLIREYYERRGYGHSD